MAWPGVCAQPCVCGMCAVSADWPCVVSVHVSCTRVLCALLAVHVSNVVCAVSVSRACVLCAHVCRLCAASGPCWVCRVHVSLSCACVMLYVSHAVCVACARVVCACLSAVHVECCARVVCAVSRAC